MLYFSITSSMYLSSSGRPLRAKNSLMASILINPGHGKPSKTYTDSASCKSRCSVNPILYGNPGGPCAKSMEVLESRMEWVKVLYHQADPSKVVIQWTLLITSTDDIIINFHYSKVILAVPNFRFPFPLYCFVFITLIYQGFIITSKFLCSQGAHYNGSSLQGSHQKFSYTWCKINKCQLAKNYTWC